MVISRLSSKNFFSVNTVKANRPLVAKMNNTEKEFKNAKKLSGTVALPLGMKEQNLVSEIILDYVCKNTVVILLIFIY